MINQLISVIIPVYNAEKHLRRCIDSIVNQEYRNLEIIIINDGSTDSSLDICKELCARDKRIRIYNTVNKGVSSARNLGLDNARGDYIGFVDSDDYISREMYRELIGAITEYDADIAECGFIVEDKIGIEIARKNLRESITEGSYDCSIQYLTMDNTFNYNWNKLYKKNMFTNIRYPQLAYSEDFVVNVMTTYKCSRKITIEGCYYHYLVNEEGAVMKPFSERKLDMIEAGKSMIKFHDNRHQDLVPYILVYTLSKIITIHKEIIDSRINNDKYLKLIRREYKSLYKLLPEKIINKKYKGLWLYSKSPFAYFALEKYLIEK